MTSFITEDMLFNVINFLVRKFSTISQPWALTGSAGQLLQGMTLQPHDIDIQTNENGAYIINNLLKEYCIENVHFRESLIIKSFFGVFSYRTVKIEVMGDIQKKVGNHWIATPDLTKIIKLKDWKGLLVPILDLKYELQAYIDLGRIDRANLIKNYLLENDK